MMFKRGNLIRHKITKSHFIVCSLEDSEDKRLPYKLKVVCVHKGDSRIMQVGLDDSYYFRDLNKEDIECRWSLINEV
jgi:hypothetical protein